MKKLTLLAAGLALSLGIAAPAGAQRTKGGAFKLEGYKLTDAGEIKKAPVSESFQGMAIYKNYLVSLYNNGYAAIYRLSPDGTFSRTATFSLGSQTKYNHANVANFGVERYAKEDVLPLLYVSQTRTDPEKNYKDACYVERIMPEGKAELVQTILLGDHDKYYGWAVQWAIDKKRKRLIGFGNTITNDNPKNNFRVMVFKLPKLKDGKTVVLQSSDILENYLIQDYMPTFPHVQVGQGGVVAGDCLVMPTGVGSNTFPSMIYSWNLKHHRMESVLNMQTQVPFEFEDCDFFQNKLYLQCNKAKDYGRMLIMSWEK